MKQTYSEITAEIARLQARAESLRKAEVSGVIARIREAINVYGLTAADLGLAGSTTKASAPAKAPRASGKVQTGVPKYRDPDSGQTWTGRGKPPLWIKDAKDRSAFLIEGTGATASETPAAPARKRASPGKAAKASTVGVPKYRDAKTGKTWTGRGKPPAWIAGVKDRIAYLIDGNAA